MDYVSSTDKSLTNLITFNAQLQKLFTAAALKQTHSNRTLLIQFLKKKLLLLNPHSELARRTSRLSGCLGPRGHQGPPKWN